MTLGTFRDQLIYPDSEADMVMKGVNDEDLTQYLEQVNRNVNIILSKANKIARLNLSGTFDTFPGTTRNSKQ